VSGSLVDAIVMLFESAFKISDVIFEFLLSSRVVYIFLFISVYLMAALLWN
jgi:hypothetical protein